MARQKRKPKHGTMSDRLEWVRKESGLTLAEFHRHLGGKEFKPYPTVQTYHHDRDAPAEYLAKVAKAFEVDLHWLSTGDGEP